MKVTRRSVKVSKKPNNRGRVSGTSIRSTIKTKVRRGR